MAETYNVKEQLELYEADLPEFGRWICKHDSGILDEVVTDIAETARGRQPYEFLEKWLVNHMDDVYDFIDENGLVGTDMYEVVSNALQYTVEYNIEDNIETCMDYFCYDYLLNKLGITEISEEDNEKIHNKLVEQDLLDVDLKDIINFLNTTFKGEKVQESVQTNKVIKNKINEKRINKIKKSIKENSEGTLDVKQMAENLKDTLPKYGEYITDYYDGDCIENLYDSIAEQTEGMDEEQIEEIQEAIQDKQPEIMLYFCYWYLGNKLGVSKITEEEEEFIDDNMLDPGFLWEGNLEDVISFLEDNFGKAKVQKSKRVKKEIKEDNNKRKNTKELKEMLEHVTNIIKKSKDPVIINNKENLLRELKDLV